MQNSSSSHDYGCSTSQKIPRLSENLKGDDNYNRQCICEHNIHPINIPKKLSVYCVGDYGVQKKSKTTENER